MSDYKYHLIQTAKGKYPSPFPLIGRSGKNYGYAEYDPTPGVEAHAMFVSKEDWEGGMDREIAENSHHSFCKWIVRAVVSDTDTLDAKIAAENDALKTEIYRLQNPKQEPETVPDAVPDAFDELSMEEPESPKAPDDAREEIKRLYGMRYRSIRSEALTLNREQGANIDVNSIKTSQGLIDAMRQFHETQLVTP